EGDDLGDPVADAVRGVLDGHIVLSRELADSGHFPAVDVLKSVSRLAQDIASQPDLAAANTLRSLLAAYHDAKDLIQLGPSVAGTDPRVEVARAALREINGSLQQRLDDRMALPEPLARLHALARKAAAAAAQRR